MTIRLEPLLAKCAALVLFSFTATALSAQTNAQALLSSQAHGENTSTGFRTQFLQLCDLAASQIRQPNGIADANGRAHFFVDAYAVRALCVAGDMTGKPVYLDSCRQWSDRMVNYQQRMTPAGAYYMHYGRKPGETSGEWYVADGASIAMALLATSVRCQGHEQARLLNSVEQFADLVTRDYVKPSGGVTDGFWPKSQDEWWCSSGTFGSLLFNLYAKTGDEHYLKTACGVVDWLNNLDLTKDQPLPLTNQGPAMLMYVLECYSAGSPFLAKGEEERKDEAAKKISWCLDWTAKQQQLPPAERPWPTTISWGMKFGGLPFHQYLFARYLPDHADLAADADHEMNVSPTLSLKINPSCRNLPSS